MDVVVILMWLVIIATALIVGATFLIVRAIDRWQSRIHLSPYERPFGDIVLVPPLSVRDPSWDWYRPPPARIGDGALR